MELRPIHIAAALDLPEICEYLISIDPDWNTVSPLGTPLECAIARYFCIRQYRSDPSSVMELYDGRYGHLDYALHCPGKTIELLRSAGSKLQSPPQEFNQQSIMVYAICCLLMSGDFAPMVHLVRMGWTVSSFEAEAFGWVVCPDLRRSDWTIRRKHRVPESLLNLISALNSVRAFESESGYDVCVSAWKLAVDMECEFLKDANMLPACTSLTRDIFEERLDHAAKRDDVQLIEDCMKDMRITGSDDQDDDAGDSPAISGTDVLHRCVFYGARRSVRFLIDCGYQVQPSYRYDFSPFFDIAITERQRMEFLLDCGLSSTAPDLKLGQTAWHYEMIPSQSYGPFSMVALGTLVELCGEQRQEALRMENNNGETPLAFLVYKLSKMSNHRFHGPDGDLTVHNSAIARILRLCDGDASCWKSSTSLWNMAALTGLEIIVQALTEANVPVDILQDSKPTPLHFLRCSVSLGCVERLQELYPTAGTKCYRDQTPLEAFCSRCVAQHIEPKDGVIKSLVDHELFGSSDGKDVRPLAAFLHQRLTDGGEFEFARLFDPPPAKAAGLEDPGTCRTSNVSTSCMKTTVFGDRETSPRDRQTSLRATETFMVHMWTSFVKHTVRMDYMDYIDFREAVLEDTKRPQSPPLYVDAPSFDPNRLIRDHRHRHILREMF
ncbi:hypothetical protein F5Y17DRAFT_257162 [Xylariaceae sp. FL0594]|nr:hypothetical protein F5Y17DRAFT_257162 [Xylariaceae sp. FL0594]